MSQSNMVQAIRLGYIHNAIAIAQHDLFLRTGGVPAMLIGLEAPEDRPALTTLLRDVVTQYPRTLLGAPVLIRWRSSRATVELPVPDSLDPAPADGLEFVSWLPLDSYIPATLPAPGDPPPTVTIASHCIQCAVALFRATPDAPDPDQHDIAHEWWATLFSETPSKDAVFLSARMLLPYPDAIEAAQVLYHVAVEGAPPVKSTTFLSDHAWAWAVDAALQYREQQREL